MLGQSETLRAGLHGAQAPQGLQGFRWGDMIFGLVLRLQQDENPEHQGMRDKCQPFPGPLDGKSNANYGRDLR